MPIFPISRGRRIRNSNWIRTLTTENYLTTDDLVLPIFLKEFGNSDFISKMPGIERHSLKTIEKEIENILNLGIKAIAVFPQIDKSLKTEKAIEAINPNNLICRTIKLLRKKFPELGLICDIALDPYTKSGHDGILGSNGLVENDKTIKILSKMSLNFAEAGCQMIAPSDMMDGNIREIRNTLEKNKFTDVCILSYSAKFCSFFYGPFRDAIGNKTNKKYISKETYQLNPKNRMEAIKNAEQHIEEGADIIMVKPANYYLDIVREIKNKCSVPVSVFQVSGEYSMLKIAAEKSILNYEETVIESLNCIKRSGANIIFSYFSKEVAEWLR